MKVEKLKINHLVNPMGYTLEHPTISYMVSGSKGKKQESARVLISGDRNFSEIIFDSGDKKDILNTGYELPVELSPETRYFWKVFVKDDRGEEAESDVAWFETAKSGNWLADWITPDTSKETQVVLFKEFNINKKIKTARVYMTGLGVYEFYLNGVKQGEECLLPGFCDYDSWIQFQTFDISPDEGKNLFEIALGDGWYKGVYGINVDYTKENYGDKLAAIAEIRLCYEDGSKETFITDTTWHARKSRIIESGIYPGESIDMTLDTTEIFKVNKIDIDKNRLKARLSPPITIHEKIRPVEHIKTPLGEDVLDMGQNMVGWFTFKCRAPKGERIKLQFGEILQDGNFYNENLRTAKAEFCYISDGEERTVRQHFTFYGYRFVKLTEWTGGVDLNDFEGLVIHSDMEEIGKISTSDKLVNQLISNARWGMKGNFLDVPTDCPQRDERYGWTGDAQIFSGTACFTMDTYAFYTKYGYDLYMEQKKLNGSVPDVVPVAHVVGDASTAWADAATIIPWNVYIHYGDKSILRNQYESMKGWVDYMRREDDRDGGRRLWQTGRHYADWLALDGNYPGGVFGETDQHFIATGYYYHSTRIVARAAKILDKTDDEREYEKLAEEIKEAFIREYFTPSGKLAVDTMTAYVCALYFELTPDFALERVRAGLLRKLKRNRYHLETGFVGTPYLCRMLSENGMNNLAYHLLMERGYPGWLYEVLMGATTIWERWNSVEPDGRISGTEMNSLNHYSYGSIVEWMYRNMVGINPLSEGAGFKKFRLAPMPDYHINHACAQLNSASGLIKSSWELKGQLLHFDFVIPFDCEAEIILPNAALNDLQAQTKDVEGLSGVRQEGKNVIMFAEPGEYSFSYKPTVPCRKIYSLDSPYEELMQNPDTKKILDEEYFIYVNHVPFEKELYTLSEMLEGPFTGVPEGVAEKIDERLRQVV